MAAFAVPALTEWKATFQSVKNMILMQMIINATQPMRPHARAEAGD